MPYLDPMFLMRRHYNVLTERIFRLMKPQIHDKDDFCWYCSLNFGRDDELVKNFITHYNGHVIAYPCWD